MEVRYRLDGLDIPAPAALLVEGPDDKRLFLPFVRHPGLVVPCSGRRHVIATHSAMAAADNERIISFIDCDYEVANKNFTPDAGVVITVGTDVEADIFKIGLLDRIVQNLIPGDIREPGELGDIADDIRSTATMLSTPLGRARMAAQPLGIELNIDNLSFARYILPSGEPDVDKMITTIHSQLKKSAPKLDIDSFRDTFIKTPDDPRLCKGKDLLASAAFVLRSRYRSSNRVNADLLDTLLRTLMADAAVFETWPVIRRIRAWEDVRGVRVLNNRLA
jgi:hypothetical protein